MNFILTLKQPPAIDSECQSWGTQPAKGKARCPPNLPVTHIVNPPTLWLIRLTVHLPYPAIHTIEDVGVWKGRWEEGASQHLANVVLGLGVWVTNCRCIMSTLNFSYPSHCFKTLSIKILTKIWDEKCCTVFKYHRYHSCSLLLKKCLSWNVSLKILMLYKC